ncbi:MAG TPA: dioxygenase, partial [Burkholderiaceae bacterium]|nr:dioxygenase [Burkholderiaceae bacterium]
SYHNLCRFGPIARDESKAFDDWLQQTLVGSAPPEREAGLRQWSQAPAARIAHPREDHLIPLMVAVGAAHEEPSECIYHEQAFRGGIAVSSFRFGAAPDR